MQREEARRLMRLGRDACTQGLPAPTNEPPWIGAGLLMREKLTDRSRENGASEAAIIALDLLEATMVRRTSKVAIECARGCSYCCSSVVSATAPEIFRLARFLSQNAAARPPDQRPDALVARAAERGALTLAQFVQKRLPCLLLVDDACSVYTARPVSCRQLMSSSRAACRDDFEGRPARIPVVEEAMQKGAHVRALMLAAVAAAGLPVTGYELSQALSIALATPRAEARWLAGEDVFAGCVAHQDMAELGDAIGHWQRLMKRVL